MKSLLLSNKEYNLINKLRNSLNYNSLNRQTKILNNYNNILSSFNKRVRKSLNENGKIYEVLYEDIGDGRGLVEIDRKELGRNNNINYRFSQMSTHSSNLGTKSYSKIINTENIKGKKYEVVYENNGSGYIEISRKLLDNSNNISTLKLNKSKRTKKPKRNVKKSKRTKNKSKRTKKN